MVWWQHVVYCKLQAAHLQLTKDTGKTGNTIFENIAYNKRHVAIVNIYHKSNFSQTTQLPDDGWKKQPKHVGELCMTF